jgi:tRNA(Ile)-lysidine synthase
MLSELNKFNAENHLLKPGDKILLAVSGGIDSMVMAHLFLHLGNKTAIAHCNFSLRGNESDNDEKLVNEYAVKHNIPFFTKRFKTKEFAKERGLSIQMAARELRYSWFEEVRSKNGFDSIAIAHNLNDNIETLLLNLVRGTGLTGMTGMKPVTNHIIRPLLFATRSDINEYCLKNKIIYREDKSNSDTKYTRNKIRHLVIPVLKEINPSVESTLNETAKRFAGINEILSEYISGVRKNVSESRKEYITFNISLLKDYLHNSTILFELFRPFGINNSQLEDLLKVIKGKTGGNIFTPTHIILKNRQDIIVSEKHLVVETDYNIKNLTGLRKVPVLASARYISIDKSFKIPSDPLIACIDCEKLSFPLVIRKWKPGDHFCPLGMKHQKKLSDYFVDNKYSKIDKEEILILESDGNIVWIVGDRLDDRYKITKSTKKVLAITAQGTGRWAQG